MRSLFLIFAVTLFIVPLIGQSNSADTLDQKNSAWLLDNFTTDTLTFYEELKIFHDKNGNTPFEAIQKNDSLFSNNTISKKIHPDEVYWAKLILQGHSEKTANYLFELSDLWSGVAWQKNGAWLVHEDGSIEQQQSGFGLSKKEKSIPSVANLARFEIKQNEKVTLYIRYQGAMKDKRRISEKISLTLLKEEMFPGLLEGYPFKGHFALTYPSFRLNYMINHEFYIDPSGKAIIEHIAKNWAEHNPTNIFSTSFKSNQVYWIKARFYGSFYFNGEQILSITPSVCPGCSFDFVDAYVGDGKGGFQHQQTGYRVPLNDRPYDFWGNFIKLNISPVDTVDLYLRIEGADPVSAEQQIFISHIASSSLFPRQVNESWKSGLFYGILGIQGIFFFLLFLIEKERIHLYFTLTILGIFLVLGFAYDNIFSFVPFPSWQSFQLLFFFLGFFLVSNSLLKFTATYFNYSKTSFFSRRLFPAYFLITAIVNGYAYSSGTLYGLPYLLVLMMFLFSIIISLTIAFRTQAQKKVSKKLFLLAFLPMILATFFLVSNVIIKNYFGFEYLTTHNTIIETMKISIVAMLTLLALSIGYRTNRLKAEKESALQKNLTDLELEVKNRTATIQEQTDKLREADLMKSRLYTNITHEFRTPLTVISGMTDMIKQQPDKAEELIKRNSEGLLHLVNQMLDLAKLESGHLELEQKQADVVPYIQYLFESFESYAASKNIRLHFQKEVIELFMDFDEKRIGSILSNLLSNAIKFSKENGEINLSLRKENGHLLLQVQDNGIGISSEKLPHIFDRFYQVDDSTTRSGEGTGIGLTLTKELVELMNGTITVQSPSSNGTGSVFTVTLPIRQNAPKELLDTKSRVSQASLTPKGSPEEIQSIDSNKEELPILLLIEDNEDVATYIKTCLQDRYLVHWSKNGAIGIKKALEIIPDIIISDVMMPEKDGFEVCQTLKNDELTSHIPIVLLTAKADVESKLEGLGLGADAYLSKPFLKEELFIRLEKLVDLRKKLQALYGGKEFLSIAPEPKPKVPSPEDIFLEKAASFIQENLDDAEFGNKELSRKMAMSDSQLNRKIKALTGKTLSLFIRSIRLQKAKILLQTTNLNVSEIAYDVGFTNPAYFSSTFSQEFGAAPSEFRN